MTDAYMPYGLVTCAVVFLVVVTTPPAGECVRSLLPGLYVPAGLVYWLLCQDCNVMRRGNVLTGEGLLHYYPLHSYLNRFQLTLSSLSLCSYTNPLSFTLPCVCVHLTSLTLPCTLPSVTCYDQSIFLSLPLSLPTVIFPFFF